MSGNSGCAIPSLADEVDFITIHILPYWEDEPIGLDRREPDGKLEHREAHRRHLQEGAGALPRQEDRDRRDRLAERRPHALRCAAGPGRAGALLLDLPHARRPRELRLQHRRSLRPVLEGAPGRHGRRRLGPARRAARRQVRARQAGRRPSRNGAMLFTLSTHAVRPDCWLASRARRRPATGKAIAIFAVFAQLVATCYVQATWIDLSRTFYFERMVGVVFWALLLGALQLCPAARHRRQPDRHDGRPVALRRAGARGVARLARAAALPHRAACRPDGADPLPGADGALHLLPRRHHASTGTTASSGWATSSSARSPSTAATATSRSGASSSRASC